MEKDNERMASAGIVGREGYEASVGLRAVERAGACPQVKGIVHEIVFCDKYNINPENIINGNHAQLTKCPTAHMKDVVMMNGGKIVGHAQLKDTISASGVKKTADQIINGHYGKTHVYGTEETAQKVAEKLAGKTKQTIDSSGISSSTTERIADKALGKMPSTASLSNAAVSGGIAGAAIGIGLETASSTIDVLKGKKEMGAAALDIAAAGIKGGVVGTASTVAGPVAAGATGLAVTAFQGTVVGSAIAATGIGGAVLVAAPAVVAVGAAVAVGSVVSNCVDSIGDSIMSWALG